ncbi:hypothetical protein N9B17_00025 [Rhodopirellula sp.]|nr:hypothetical protein [Rhodopirellula sp.]
MIEKALIEKALIEKALMLLDLAGLRVFSAAFGVQYLVAKLTAAKISASC